MESKPLIPHQITVCAGMICEEHSVSLFYLQIRPHKWSPCQKFLNPSRSGVKPLVLTPESKENGLRHAFYSDRIVLQNQGRHSLLCYKSSTQGNSYCNGIYGTSK